MPLITCRDCSKLVSPNAAACPNCGRPITAHDVTFAERQSAELKRKWYPRLLLGALCVVGFFFFVWIGEMSSGSSGPPLAQPQGDVLSPGPKTTQQGHVVCTTENGLKRAVELSGDRMALVKYLADLSNGCAILKPGLSVVVEDYEFGGYIRVRLPGEPTSMWITKEAVR